ncbi:hypothetical protein J6590_072919 [Homalodisca vitripennis]|nr:hypothetical protein J6590_072919 [Homalodisca vitripennis]
MTALHLSIWIALFVGFVGAHHDTLDEKYSWSTIEYAYDTDEECAAALADGSYCPENVIPTGISVWTDKMIFMTIPRRTLTGVPATLVYISCDDDSTSPRVIPYPSFSDNNITDCNCDNIISVNRGARIDKYDRLWVFDYGKIGRGSDAVQVCPPRIHIFDLNTHEKLCMYTLKDTDYYPTSLFTSIVLDSGDTSDDCWLYAADQIGIIVYSLKDNDSWRFDHPYCWPDPIAWHYLIDHIHFDWPNAGVFGLALSALNHDGYKTLYFHPLSGFREFSISTEILHDKERCYHNYHDGHIVGCARPYPGHVSTQVMDRESGVLFFNLIDINAVGCWNSHNQYAEYELDIVAKDDEKLVWPSDIIIDGNECVWLMSNRYIEWLYGTMDFTNTNFRLFYASVHELIHNTTCDPSHFH